MDTNEKDDFDLQGRLGCFSLSDLLQTLSFTQKTGTLTLIQGWNTRTICYENGRITYIAAATRLPTVVELLMQNGQLTVKQLEHKLGKDWKTRLGIAAPMHAEPDTSLEAVAKPVPATAASLTSAKDGQRNGSANGSGNGSGGASAGLNLTSTNRHLATDPDLLAEFGDLETFIPPEIVGLDPNADQGPDIPQILLENKLATFEQLSRCEEQIMENTIYTLFLWRNSRFTFQGDLLVKADGIPVSVSAEKLIIEGTRRVDEWIRISPVIPSVLMAFRRLPRPVTGPLSEEARDVLAIVDGVSDVATIARKRGCSQFDSAKLLHGLTRLGLVQPVPPDKNRVMDLFKYTAEAIYIKLVMYGYSRKAMEFEYELNRFARENKLKVRMHIGKIRLTDLDLPLDATALLDFYKLFIAIENNKFAKLFPPEIHKGLTEALYHHMDPEARALMRMYEFHAMEGLLDMPPVTEVEA